MSIRRVIAQEYSAQYVYTYATLRLVSSKINITARNNDMFEFVKSHSFVYYNVLRVKVIMWSRFHFLTLKYS